MSRQTLSLVSHRVLTGEAVTLVISGDFDVWELYWPEYVFTGPKVIDKIWHKLKESNEKHHDITCLFSWIKKIYKSLCLELFQFVLLIPHHSTPLDLHSASCHILPWSYLREQVKTPPIFLRIQIILPKRSQFCLPKWHV